MKDEKPAVNTMDCFKKHKALIVGAGHAGVDLHFKAYSKLENVEVSAFCDVDEHTVKAVCARHHIKGCYTDLEKAIDETAPDIISVTTPPGMHFEIAKKGLESGAVVLVEKPIFMSVEEAREIEAFERKSAGKIVPVHNLVSEKGIKQAVEMTARGIFGEIVHINAYWMKDGRKNEMTSNPGHWAHSLPGGRWEELIPHRLYIPYRFVGKMDLLHVDLIKTERSLPWLPGDEVIAVLESRSGYVTIRLSANTKTYNFYSLYGTKNSAKVLGDKVVLEHPLDEPGGEGTAETISRYFFKGYRRLAKIMCKRTEVKKEDDHYNFIKEIIEAIDGKKEMPVSWDEALNTLQLTMEIGREIRKKWKP